MAGDDQALGSSSSSSSASSSGSSESMQTAPTAQSSQPRHEPPRFVDALVLFALLLGFYHVNGVLSLGNDMTANVALPTSILNEGNLTFTPDEFPRLFRWQVQGEEGPEEVYVHTWEAAVQGKIAGELRDTGEIELLGPQYNLAETTIAGEYISATGIGAGITALPAMAVLYGIFGDLRYYSIPALYAGKFAAAASVAGSALCLFLIASTYLRRNAALLVAMTYGLGTGVWAISSQGLWSHGPNILYLSLGAYFLLRVREGDRFALFSGLASGMALLCRPSSVIFAIVAGLWLAYQNRRQAAYFLLGVSGFAALYVLYSLRYQEVLWYFGLTPQMAEIARSKTGSASVWQFNILESAVGLLISPSRGLLIFSPVMAFALAGMVRAWREERFAALRPISILFGVTFFVQLFWYDWWGGWSYGYRPIVDTMMYLAVFLIPAMDWIRERRVLAGVFACTLIWSLVVQGIGAFAAVGSGWNNRMIYKLDVNGQVETFLQFVPAQNLLDAHKATLVSQVRCDVDRPECRYRLWSIADSQLVYHFRHYAEERERKRYLSNPNRFW